jgi:hypothetical protein
MADIVKIEPTRPANWHKIMLIINFKMFFIIEQSEIIPRGIIYRQKFNFILFFYSNNTAVKTQI